MAIALKSNMNNFFRKGLTDLVRGIRANKKNEHEYISKCLAEIKEEVKLVDTKAKMNAVAKLTYLHMLGYDINWAAFNIIEVMSNELFTAKRIGYLAASQSFHQDTDVIMLATALLKKDLTSTDKYETGLAINCLANICTPDLARDLASDVVALCNSTRPYVRKKSALALYKIFLQFPQALRPSFPRLREKLEDSDMSVVSAAVNVICELARKSPKNYLPLAPIFFNLLTTSTNNWMLIKIIKLFGALTPLERRLAKKLVDPLTDIMNTTNAMSLLYECIQTCTIGLSHYNSVIRLCISKLRLFIEDSDQNLKYLGLLALYNIMKTHPKAVTEHRDMVIWCLDDEDVTIRLRALDLITGMVTKRTLMDIVQKLTEKLEIAEGSYKDDLIEKVIQICSQGNYQFITDFEWYINVLVELTHVEGTKLGAAISQQLLDVCIRVNIIREVGVANMASLLRDPRLIQENLVTGGMCEVLYAAAYITGEFSKYTKNRLSLLEAYLQPRIALIPGHIQCLYMHNALKILVCIAQTKPSEFPEALALMKERLPVFTHSTELEVQERACFALELVNIITELVRQEVNITPELISLFAGSLNPVSSKAQKKVPIPDGLDLDAQINEPPPDSESDDEYGFDGFGSDEERDGPVFGREKLSHEEAARQRKQRQSQKSSNPFYLGGAIDDALSDEEYPIEPLTNEFLGLPEKHTSSSSRRKRRPKKPQKVEIITAEEMPEGAGSDSDEDNQDDESNPFGDIDLTADLSKEETDILTTKAYPLPGEQQPQQAKKPERKKRRRPRKGSKRGGRGDRGDDRPSRRSRKDGRDARDGKKRRSKPQSSATTTTTSASGNLLDLGFSGDNNKPQSGSLLDLGSAPKPIPAQVKEDRYSQLASPTASTEDVRVPSSQQQQGRRKRSKSAAASAKRKRAGRNRDIDLSYELGVNPSQPTKVLVVFHIKNIGRGMLGAAEFNVTDTLNTKLIRPAQLTLKDLHVKPRQSVTHKLLFQFNSFSQAQVMNGFVQLKIDGGDSKLNFEFEIPSSAFIQLQDNITEAAFINVMQSTKLYLASSRMRLESPSTFVTEVANLLHVSPVQVAGSTALYGKSLKGDHVCISIKVKAKGASIEIKCSDAALGNSLLAEVKRVFKM